MALAATCTYTIPYILPHTIYQLPSPSCSTRAIQKGLSLNKTKQQNIKNFLDFERMVGRNEPLAKNDKIDSERATGLGRRRTEIGKGNQIYDHPEIPDKSQEDYITHLWPPSQSQKQTKHTSSRSSTSSIWIWIHLRTVKLRSLADAHF